MVFNYRFSPNENGDLYDKAEAWYNFWSTSKENIAWYSHAVYIDIADFYNRIYHHTLENQLIACGFENQVIKAIKNLLQNTTQTTSQGIPTGPHASHIYAEMCLIPLDEGLICKGYEFCRYADDIIIFTDSEVQARIVIYEMAKILDSLKLNMQRNKTRIFNQEEFEAYCDDMLVDNPISELEKEMNTVLSNHLDRLYGDTDYVNLDDINKEFFSEETLQKILLEYLDGDLDYQRIRWFYKRLSKVGVDTALGVTVKEFDRLIPAINDIALYFASIADSSGAGLREVGRQLLGLLKNEIIKSNDFFQITILNLFSYTNKFNHISNLINLFGSSNDYVKREIILAAYTSDAVAWIREIKQEYLNLGIWTQRALLIASSLLPVDERKYFIQNVTSNQQENLTIKLISKIILKK